MGGKGCQCPISAFRVLERKESQAAFRNGLENVGPGRKNLFIELPVVVE